jgi:hypothetical protein
MNGPEETEAMEMAMGISEPIGYRLKYYIKRIVLDLATPVISRPTNRLQV